MSGRRVLFGFHAVAMRLKTAPSSVIEVIVDPARRDGRMQRFLAQAHAAGVRLTQADESSLARLAGSPRHQGVAARVEPMALPRTVLEVLDALDPAAGPPFVLVLDGVTDPHNLGACLRVADAAGVHAVVAPKDHAVAVNATVAKVASGAADTVPYLMVTNLARALAELKAAGVVVVGTSDGAEASLHDEAVPLAGPLALVLGAEGKGLRDLTRRTCDALVRIPMAGAVESLNVSVAAGVCCYEALRRRAAAPTATRPAASIAQVPGSGTTPTSTTMLSIEM
jgi:23S rRNA (guanosine2251-2'-O)-methyltransferase